MDFRHVKQLILPEGSVKELRIGGITVWRRPSAGNYSVAITTDNTSAITGAKYKQAYSKTFTAEYNVPSSEQDSVPVWTVSGLPSGMSAESLNGDNLTISGTPNAYGDFTLTVSVTKGSYTDSKEYTLTVEYVAYGVTITTSNASNITDFYQLKYASKTFSASFNVPPANASDAATWTISGLPSGLSASGATVSGYADNTGTYTVTVKVTKAGYSDTKQYTLVVEKADKQLQITGSSLAAAYSGSAYSATVTTNASKLRLKLSSFVCTGGLPQGLSASVHSGQLRGLVSGTTTNQTTTTYSPTFYAVSGEYKSPAKTLSMTSYGTLIPQFYTGSDWTTAHSATATLSAADIRNDNKVGITLWSGSFTGRYLRETSSGKVLCASSSTKDNYYFDFAGYSGSAAANAADGYIKLAATSATVSYAERYNVTVTLSSNNNMNVSIILLVKTGSSVATITARNSQYPMYWDIELYTWHSTTTFRLYVNFTS